MRHLLFVTILSLGLVVPNVYAEPVANRSLMLSLQVTDTQIKVDFSVVKALPFESTAVESTGPYRATLLGQGNETLYSTRFNDPLQMSHGRLATIQHILALPDLPQAKRIRFDRDDPATGKLITLGTEPLPKPIQ